MFMNATVEEIPEGFFEGLSAVKYISQLFEYATFNVPPRSGMFKGLINATAGAEMFYGTNLTEIPSGIFEGLGEQSASLDMSKAFFGCKSLTHVPADVFDAIATKVTTLKDCFRTCENLKTVADGFANESPEYRQSLLWVHFA